MPEKISYSKTLWINLLFLGLPLLSISQTYHPLLETDNYWVVTSCHFGCLTDEYWTEEDTIIAGRNYRFLNGYHYNRNMFLREDTSSRQIFFRSILSNKDVLLYDFSMNVGDSITINNPISPLPANQGTYVLDSIVLRNVLNGDRRFFYLSSVNTNAQTLWVEGIGSLALINTPGGLPDLNGMGELSCFFQDGQQVYEADSLPASSCNNFVVSSNNTTTIPNNQLQLYPNPSQGTIQIDLGELEQNLALILLDQLGRVLAEYHYKEVAQLELQLSVPNGLYFLEIRTDKGLRNRQRVFIQR